MVSTPERAAAPALPPQVGRPPSEAQLASFEPVVLQLPASWTLTDEEFIELSQENPGWDFETTEEGALLIMAGEGEATSAAGAELMGQLWYWNRRRRGGQVRGPSGACRLTSKLRMVPDASWTSNERYAERDDGYGGLLFAACPELIIEIRSGSDNLSRQQEKMETWRRQGARLGWLVDPQTESVWVYRAGVEAPEELVRPASLSGEDVCEGLVVELADVWAVLPQD